MPSVEIKQLGSAGISVPLPSYQSEGAAAVDLHACISEPASIAPHAGATISTGIAISMPDASMVAIVAGRSGLCLKHNIRIGQGIGVIDSDYQGEIKVLLHNDGNQTYVVHPGDRIAQLMFMPVLQVEWKLVTEFSSETRRGAGGFGSTGKH